MALDTTKFSRVGPQNSNAPTIFTYASGSDALTTVDASGYFNDLAPVLQPGDLIYVAPTTGACGFLKVDTNTRDLAASPPVEGVVDTLNALSLGTVDSD
jgi:hypothetical protein